MELITDLLATEDFGRIPGLPLETFTLAPLQAYYTQFREGWLAGVLPDSNPFWAILPANDTPASTLIRGRLKAFAVYAIWSACIRQGHVQYTKSGLVTKDFSQSTPLDAEQRASLARTYKDLATEQATKLLGLLAAPDTCGVEPRSTGGVRVGVVLPRSSSPFS